MQIASLQECFCDWDQETGTLVIGNGIIERRFLINEDRLYSRGLKRSDVDRDESWVSEGMTLPFSFGFLPYPPKLDIIGDTPAVCTAETAEDGKTRFLRSSIDWRAGSYRIRLHLDIFPGLPFVVSRLWVRGPAFIDREQAPLSGGTPDEYEGLEDDEAFHCNGSRLRRIEAEDLTDSLPFNLRHARVTELEFQDVTDLHDQLVLERSSELYHAVEESFSGNIFVIKKRDGRARSSSTLMVVKEGPTLHGSLNRRGPELHILGESYLALQGSGLDPARLDPEEWQGCYGWSIGLGETEELRRAYRRLYRAGTAVDRHLPLIVSNTWGDRNKDTALKEEFIRAELDIASRIGVDRLQIDDGWQQGITKNSGIARGGVWEGYYAADPDFWKVNRKKFPRGLGPLSEAAQAQGLKLSLWFSPDSSGDFNNWERDAEILLDFHRRLGVDLFKIDGVKLRSKQSEANLAALYRHLMHESGDRLQFNPDLTAEVRAGYFYQRAFGILFLENRYTDWGNYYPYRTLRNLWDIARILPARRFQIEVLNPERNRDRYGDDPWAPCHYPMDYLFAVSIVANPLLFMELQHLSEENIELLSHIVALYRRYRDNLAQLEIEPIGKRPDGTGISGFLGLERPNGEARQLLLFRDLGDDSLFSLPPEARRPWRELYESRPQVWEQIDEVTMRINSERSFIWLIKD